MNKNQAELISYAIMPRHVMETVLTVDVICLLRKSPELSANNTLKFFSAGFDFCEASENESPLGTIASRYSQLTISEDGFNKELITKVSVIIGELLN